MKRPTQIIKKYTKVSLVLRIFIGLVIGALLGLLVPSWTGIGILGRMFVSALKGIAPVLVAVLVTSSIAKAGKGHREHKTAHHSTDGRDESAQHINRNQSGKTMSMPFTSFGYGRGH